MTRYGRAGSFAVALLVFGALPACTATRRLRDDVREGRALLRDVSFEDQARERRRLIFLKNADEDAEGEASQ